MSGFWPLKLGRSLFGLGYRCLKYTPLFVATASDCCIVIPAMIAEHTLMSCDY